MLVGGQLEDSVGHWKSVRLSQAKKKQWWPSNQGICLATRVRGSACWDCLEWLTNRQNGKTFLDFVKLRSQAKKRRAIPRDQKDVGEAGQTQSQRTRDFTDPN